MKNKDTMLLTLCGVCVRQFNNANGYIVRRADHNQKVKDSCCYCGCRTGWDYTIINKNKKNETDAHRKDGRR